MDAEKEALIAELDCARERLNLILDRVTPQVEIYPSWKLKQVLDHVAGWDDAVIAAILSHSRGDVPAVTAPRGIDYYNTETVTTRESLPLEQTRREYEVTREQLKQAIRDMPSDKFTQPFVSPWGKAGTMAWLVKIFVEHELEHAREIEEILNKVA
jgi:DinB superfamily